MLIGGGLIVVALLLTCGPMTNWFGIGDNGVNATPDVAAGPPAGSMNAAGSLAAATAGALAGGEVGNADVAAAMSLKEKCDRERQMLLDAGLNLDTLDPDCDGIGGGAAVSSADRASGAGIGSGAAIAGAGSAGASGAAGAAGAAGLAAGAGAGAVIAGTSGSGGSGSAAASGASALPPVSAGGPNVNVGNLSAVSPAAALAAAAATATGAFDESFAGNDGQAQSPAAGKVVDRFAPPVAAVGNSGMALAANGGAFGIQAGGVRASCDSPGAGCSSLRSGTVRRAPPVPPIVGGTRPNRNREN